MAARAKRLRHKLGMEIVSMRAVSAHSKRAAKRRRMTADKLARARKYMHAHMDLRVARALARAHHKSMVRMKHKRSLRNRVVKIFKEAFRVCVKISGRM